MSRQHYLTPQGTTENALTVRLGAGNTSGDNYNDKENGKFVKLVGESRYALASAGDDIEAVIQSVDLATQGGYSIGGVVTGDMIFATADGLQATPGTGTIAVGDYVVVGTVVAKGTAQTGYPKVCKATNQPGATVTVGAAGADTAAAIKTVTDAALAKVTDAQKHVMHGWRVESLYTAGTGAVGTTIVLRKVSS